MPKRKRGCNTCEDALTELNLRIANLSKELKKKKQRQRYQEGRAVASALTPFMKTVLVLLYVFGGYNPSLASSYWLSHQKKRKRPPLPTSLMHRHIEDAFLSYTDDELSLLVDANFTSQRQAWRRAAYFQNKMKLRRWVRTQNVQRGLAPNSRMVIREYNMLRKDTPFLFLQRDHPDPATHSSTRVFLNRWRKEVRGKWKSIRVLEYVSLEHKRAKVCLQTWRTLDSLFGQKQIKKRTLDPGFGPKNGAIFRSCF